MGDHNYFDELIVSYLSNELNADEEAFVLDWINSSEANKKYFEELRTTWNLLSINKTVKDINVDREWDKFRERKRRRGRHLIGAKVEFSDDEPKGFHSVASDKLYPKVFGFLSGSASSLTIAAFILVVALGWKIFYNSPAPGEPIAFKVTKEMAPKAPFIRHQFNLTDKSKLLVLGDGTKVTLYVKSEISYSEPFIDKKRDITLTGKAKFKVAKDKTRPFTVFTGDISTTALGTEFTVVAFKNEGNIVIRLHEGKVVVKSTKKATRKLRNDYYLLPGQELTYDYNNSLVRIRSLKSNADLTEKNIKNDSNVADHPSLTKLGEGTWYMFNNQPLPQVFDQLSHMFNVKIVYSKKDFSKLYFIGRFNAVDSLDSILKEIAIPNNLKITKEKDKRIIIK